MVESEIVVLQRICEDLGLPRGDSYTQDWAYELPEEFRSEAAFYRYVEAYKKPAYGEAERRLIVQLALDVANDLVGEEATVGTKAWKNLVTILRTDPALHRDQLEYWAVPGEPLVDAFALTPLVRDAWEELYARAFGD